MLAGELRITADEFVEAYVKADPGERICYFVGQLAFECDTKPAVRTKRFDELRTLRETVWNYYTRGKVLLTQRVIGPPIATRPAQYYATKIVPPSRN